MSKMTSGDTIYIHVTTHKTQELTRCRPFFCIIDDRFAGKERLCVASSREDTAMSPDRSAMYRNERGFYYLFAVHCDMFLFWRDTRWTWKAPWRWRGNQVTVVRADEGTDEKNDIVRTLALIIRTNDRKDGREKEVDKKREDATRISYPIANPIARASRTATTGCSAPSVASHTDCSHRSPRR